MVSVMFGLILDTPRADPLVIGREVPDPLSYSRSPTPFSMLDNRLTTGPYICRLLARSDYIYVDYCIVRPLSRRI